MAFNASNKNIVKVAVTMKEESNTPFLGHFNLNDPLSCFIKVLCNHFKLDNPEDYGLQYVDPPNHYISDGNRDKLKNGVLLMVVSSVSRLCERMIKSLSSGTHKEKTEALQILAKHSNDPLVAEKFIKLQGIVFLVSGVEEDKFEMHQLGNALISFIEIMDHGFLNWDSLQQQFIKKIVSFINVQLQTDSTVLQTSLTILESVVLNSEEHYNLVENMITLPHLLQHISNCKAEGSSQIEIQQSVLALVNALFLKAEPHKRKYFFSTLTTRQYRNIIIDNILASKNYNTLVGEMKHQLYVLQQLLLNTYDDRMHTPLDPEDQVAAKSIRDLRTLAFEERETITTIKDVSLRRLEMKHEFKKLGFKDDADPAKDFREAPPGMLALDNMCYFARTHSDQCSKLVMENCYRSDSHECPFGRASIELTKLLCEILNIGEMPSEQGQVFYPMMFAHDHSFEELFSICIVIFNKTWKEMKATTEDFSKVVSVIRVQINRTMNEFPPTLDRFHENINKLNYSKVAKIWQDELLYHEEKEMQAPPILELTKRIKEEMIELVQQQRLNFLVEGTRFQVKSRSSKEKKYQYQYWRLSPNHKFLHYGNCAETTTPSVDELPNKIAISDIKDLVTGKDCPHKKEKKYMFPFSLLLEDNHSHDFYAPDEKTYHFWQDGINALLRRTMTSEAAKQDMDILVNMELKLRLLDTEGVHIPQSPPPIPPPPPNYNFSYQSGYTN
ncbi:Engulfment and cell motility protein 1 [Armadillidium nasatum]|uniref:Engulfment and cell motility protein 1 n=1 Tax=Armadillidium nasatum TaxID=96803 RepID=A0A5N5T7K3_9CRUS|nr:Engulfment and cell motility protein 1 [Armadillidium nasatum]